MEKETSIEAPNDEIEMIGDVILATKHATTKVNPVKPWYSSTSSTATTATTHSAPFLVDINRTIPFRVRDLSTVSSASTLMRYVSPLALSFHERSTRHRFVRNMFAVLTLQFSFITGLSLTAEFLEPVSTWLKLHESFILIPGVTVFVMIFAMACIRELRNKCPINCLMLLLFTLALGSLFAFVSAYDKTFITVMALGLVTLVCFCITLDALQTKHNVTTWGLFMYVAVQGVLIFAVGAAVLLKFTPIAMNIMIYSFLIALTFCLYLAYDTQEILAGKRKEVNPNDVILAVIKLYVDSLYIFCIFCFLCEQANH